LSEGRLRKAYSESEFESVIDDYITQGFKVKSRGEKSAQMIKAVYGSMLSHLILFVFTFWTFFIANILWLAYNYTTKSEKVLVKLVEKIPQ
jgi:hypothetical protein